MISSGTKSYFFGCHNFILHPIFVIAGWKIWHRRWPKLWEIVCIFLHDIGVIGQDYLVQGGKDGHWKRGAELARSLFDERGYKLCAGHTNESGFLRSDLFWADKVSWIAAPNWWMQFNYFIEGFEGVPPDEWKRRVAENLNKKNPEDNHTLYEKFRSEGRLLKHPIQH